MLASSLGTKVKASFGSNAKAVRKGMLKSKQQALWMKTKHLAASAQVGAIAEQVVKQGLSINESLALARTTLALDSAVRLEKHEEAMVGLLAYRAGQGAELVQEVASAIPELAAFQLEAVPGPVPCVRVGPPVVDNITNAVAWAHACASTNLGACLESAWKQDHQPIDEPQGQGDEHAGKGEAMSACRVAGMCLCDDTGRKIIRIVAKLLAAMMKIFPHKSDARQLLLDGFVVLRLSGQPDTDDYEEVLATGEEFVDFFFHVGLMYLSPFQPTFALVKQVADQGEAAPRARRVYVQAIAPRCDHHISLSLAMGADMR